MAKDMLQAVFNAEEECRLRESNAKAVTRPFCVMVIETFGR